jgi:hypothetical protein
VWQEEKIKTAGLETSVPLEEEPAGCQRSDRKDCRQDASDPIRGKPWNATIPGGIGWRVAGRKDKDCRSGDQRSIRRRAGRMPAVR